jgi:chromosome segregation ATPase
MMDAARSGRAGDEDGRYDFDRLERSIDFLIDEHRRLSAEREALLGELLDREHRIATLESRLESERSSRSSAVSRVYQILTRLNHLHASVVTASETA